MQTRSLTRAAAAAIASLGCVAACDDPVSRLPTQPAAPFVSNIEISGPGTIEPGQSIQFTATTRLSNGAGKVAANLRWRSSRTSVLQVNDTGLATAGQEMGDATLTAELIVQGGVRRSTKEVVVLPDGTFRIVGLVTEADAPSAPVVGARVEVVPGSVFAMTGEDGRYRLYGVPADANIRVTAPGYEPQEQHLLFATHATRNFQLPLAGPPLNLTGRFTLAIDVDGGCPGGRPLSTDLQHRRYEAVLTQTGSTVQVELTAPGFRANSIGRGSRFSGRASAVGARFTLEPFYTYYYPYYGPSSYPSVAEALANGTFLVPEGSVVTTGSASGLSGQMSGGIYNWDSRFPSSQFLVGSCFGSLRFTLTPR